MFPPYGSPSPWSSPGMFGPPQMGSGDPLNFGNMFGSATPLVSVGASLLSNHLAQSQGLQQLQFLPSQNAYDQLRAQQALQNQMTSMQVASANDRRQVEMMMRGAYTIATGQAPGIAQMAQIRTMSSHTPAAVGMMTQFFGTNIVDQAFGGAGSATAMGNIMSRAGQTMYDPVTGAIGMSGRSSGAVSTELFNQLYGRGQSVGAMKGITAGRAAEMVEQLAYRGLLGQNVGASPNPSEFISRLQTSPDMINRLAEQSDAIQTIRKSGRQPTAQEMQSAVSGISQTIAQAKTTSDVLSLPGGGDLLRTSQAQSMKGKLENISGAVKAMEEIFGSEGRPNASMLEIFNRLQSVTQGGLANMSGSQVEALVRKTQSLAQAAGVSVSAIEGLMGQGAAIADRYNVPRSLVPAATHRALEFSNGARLNGLVAKNTDLGMTSEELTIADQQLRLSAAGSAGGTDIAGVSRLVAEGMLDINGNTDAAKMAQAIRDGKTTFKDSAGKERSIRMTRGERMALLEKAGVDRDTAEAVISDVRANAEYQNVDLARKLQYDELVDQFSPIAEQAVKDQAAGLGLNTKDVGRNILQNIRHMEQEGFTNGGAEFTKATRGIVEKTLRDSMKARGMSDDEIAKRLTPQMVSNIALQLTGNVDNNLIQTGSGYKSLQNVVQLHGTRAFDSAEKFKEQSDADVALRAALGGLGTQGPLSRVADALKNAKEGDSIGTILGAFFNAVPKDAAKGDKATGAVMELLGLVVESEGGELEGESASDRNKLKKSAAGAIDALLTGKGDTSGLITMLADADKAAAAAAKRGDKATAAKWQKRADSLRGISDTAAKVASGEIVPKQWSDVPTGATAGAGLPTSVSSMIAGGVALAQEAWQSFTKQRKSDQDDAKKEDKKREPSKISGVLRLEGLDKGRLMAVIDSGDDSPEHGGSV